MTSNINNFVAVIFKYKKNTLFKVSNDSSNKMIVFILFYLWQKLRIYFVILQICNFTLKCSNIFKLWHQKQFTKLIIIFLKGIHEVWCLLDLAPPFSFYKSGLCILYKKANIKKMILVLNIILFRSKIFKITKQDNKSSINNFSH